jgi:hypothetical protein
MADSTCHLARSRWPLPKHRSHHRPRSDRRLACPARKRRRLGRSRLRVRLSLISSRRDGSAREGHDFSRAVRSLKRSALAAGGLCPPRRMSAPHDPIGPEPETGNRKLETDPYLSAIWIT